MASHGGVTLNTHSTPIQHSFNLSSVVPDGGVTWLGECQWLRRSSVVMARCSSFSGAWQRCVAAVRGSGAWQWRAWQQWRGSRRAASLQESVTGERNSDVAAKCQ